jgi:hypothetical protein
VPAEQDMYAMSCCLTPFLQCRKLQLGQGVVNIPAPHWIRVLTTFDNMLELHNAFCWRFFQLDLGGWEGNVLDLIVGLMDWWCAY